MRKTLLYSLLITLTSLWTGAVKADEVTIDFSKKGYDNATQVIKLTQDGISLEFDKGTNSNNTPKYYTTGTAVRCYGGNWFSVTAASATITKIVFTFASGEGTNAITADAGTFETDTWTGSSSSVKFTIGGTTGHRRIQKMVVTTGEGGDTPVDTRTDANLSFSTTTAEATVGEDFTPPTLSNPSNVSVYYSSSNGEVATVDFDGVVTLKGAGTTTITASVYEWDEQYKGSASYTLTVAAPQVVPTVTLPYEEEFKGVGKGKFYIEDVNVGGLSYVWSYDSKYGMKASAFVSSTSHTTESWLISPLIDLTNANDPIFTFDHALNKFTDVATAKQEATVWVRVGEDGEWYQVSNVTYPSSQSWSFVNAGELPLDEFVGKKIQIGFKYTSTATNAGTWEIQNFKVNDGEIVVTYDDMTVAELCELTKAQDNINLTFTDALVTYVQGKSAYIREGENAICAYDLGIALKEGQTINGSVKVDFEPYRGMHEIKANTATTDDELTITDAAAGTTVAPTEATLSELLEGKHAADYIVLRGVQIISEETASGAKGLNGATAETTTYYAADEAGAKIQLFSPSDDITAKANDGKKYDIEAIFAGAGSNKSITPLAISETTAINNITTDEALKQKAPIYNLAGQRVGESYKGIVIVNGKKIKK
ncbi:MAG: choice-of-anchor J domain-containing protein [Prevotella sp.]|nr:choice-of-anchor J domain-containing protein [Prevotella sp.]